MPPTQPTRPHPPSDSQDLPPHKNHVNLCVEECLKKHIDTSYVVRSLHVIDLKYTQTKTYCFVFFRLHLIAQDKELSVS